MHGDFLSPKDLSLYTSSSRFTLASALADAKLANVRTTFDLFVRELPSTRNFLVFLGLEHVVQDLLNFRISPNQLGWLRRSMRLSPMAVNALRGLQFTGDVWAMPEGTIFFAQEPVIRVTAPLLQAELIEVLLINEVYGQTIMASKIARFVSAAQGKKVAIGISRAFGLDAGMRTARINEIFGNSHPLAIYHYRHATDPFSIGTFHFFVKAFRNELEAFRVYFRSTGGRGYVLVDTYDTIQGIRNFIQVASEKRPKQGTDYGIQLDSGDLYRLSVRARKMLDAAGLRDAKIFVMSNLDEWKVAGLVRRRAPIDVYAGTTALLTPNDAPTIELVYKMSEIERHGRMVPVMKTSTRKVSYPGRKQVYRIMKKRRYDHDVLGLLDERVGGRPLLTPVIKQGKLRHKLPSVREIGAYYRRETERFPQSLLSIAKKHSYPVQISTALRRLHRTTLAILGTEKGR